MLDRTESVFDGMVTEDELVDLVDMNQDGGWQIVGSITAIIGITFVFCPTAPCSNTGYCK